MKKDRKEVLIVEDQEAVRLFLSDLLLAHGWEVWLAENAEDVIRNLGVKEPVAALIDPALPGMNGLPLSEEIKRLLPKTEVILINSHASPEMAIEAMGKGVYSCIRKSLEAPEEVIHLLQRALEKRRLSEENVRLIGDLNLSYLLLSHFAQNITRQDLKIQSLMEQMKTESIHDPLTGLYNRRFFDHRIKEEIARTRRNGGFLAVLLCDLDHFKAVNETLGHQTGDEILKKVAQGIQESTRGSDLVFRWGGDEIVAVLPETSQEGVLTAANRIRKDVRRMGEEVHFPLDISIGAALYPQHAGTIDQIISLADRALHIAKQEEEKIHLGDHAYLVDDHAIMVVFQPVVDTRSNQVIGYEALSRDPQGKLGILDLFKRYQAVGQLSALKEICFNLQLKMASALQLKRVFINVDLHLLHQIEVPSKPSNVEVILEISEAEALGNIKNSLEMTGKWREGGFKFAIDDFGAGFISLPFIAQLVPDYIKLDRSTILQAASSEQFKAFLKELVSALRNYFKEGIIAEGIETEEELKVTKDMGICLMQGFLLGKPQALINDACDGSSNGGQVSLRN